MRWLIVFVLLAVACDKPAEMPATPETVPAQTVAAEVAMTPNEVILAYYAAMGEARYADAYEMVSEPDRNARSLGSFTASASVPLQEVIARNRTYELKDVQIADDKALVMVDTTGPDIASLQKYVLKKYMSENTEPPDSETLKALMAEAIDRPDAPKIITHNRLFLLKDGSGRWTLDFDWDEEHPQRGVPEQERPKKPAPDAGP